MAGHAKLSKLTDFSDQRKFDRSLVQQSDTLRRLANKLIKMSINERIVQ